MIFLKPLDKQLKVCYNNITKLRKEVITMAKKVDKRIFKKEGEELQQYLALMRKHGVVENKKGKGSYSRKTKHKKGYEE